MADRPDPLHPTKFTFSIVRFCTTTNPIRSLSPWQGIVDSPLLDPSIITLLTLETLQPSGPEDMRCSPAHNTRVVFDSVTCTGSFVDRLPVKYNLEYHLHARMHNLQEPLEVEFGQRSFTNQIALGQNVYNTHVQLYVRPPHALACDLSMQARHIITCQVNCTYECFII